MINRAKQIGYYVFNQWIKRYERYLTAGALIFGFIFDSFTLTQIDFLYENVVIVGYLFLGMATILISALSARGKLHGALFERVGLLAPIVLQFSFGGLFSAFLVFFSRSASLLASWPFIFVLVGILIGNEFFKERYQRFSFQILVWYVALYLYIVLVLPVIVKSIGFGVFFASGVLALGIVALFIKILKKLTPSLMHELARAPYYAMLLCFVVMNALYLFNIIPPFPLALKDAGPYELVVRSEDGEYVRKHTELSWYAEWFFRDLLVIAPGGSAYFFTAIFLPSNLNTVIVHHWQRYDEVANEWIDVATPSFSMRGGRIGGYRGYTWVDSVVAGLWRVRVETPRGQLLGRETFRIILSDVVPTE